MGWGGRGAVNADWNDPPMVSALVRMLELPELPELSHASHCGPVSLW